MHERCCIGAQKQTDSFFNAVVCMIQHLACIMDGNRRWARQHGLSRVGADGIDAAQRVVEWCLQHGIKHLSLFAFSLENYNRPAAENTPLFILMAEEMVRRAEILIQHGVRVQFIGQRAYFPATLKEECMRLEQLTAGGTALNLYILFCYGSRQEIVDTTKRIAVAVAQGKLTVDAIDDTLFAQYLWTAGVPDPDLIIRPGYVHRLSNFLLYQAAYAELFFVDVLWPDITPAILDAALSYYQSVQRNFGL